jgi:hypothetical protein
LELPLASALTVTAAEKRYYWFSAKQYLVITQHKHHEAWVMVDGKRLYFTEQTRTSKPDGSWDDYHFVALTDSSNERFSPRRDGYVFDSEWIDNPSPRIEPWQHQGPASTR